MPSKHIYFRIGCTCTGHVLDTNTPGYIFDIYAIFFFNKFFIGLMHMDRAWILLRYKLSGLINRRRQGPHATKVVDLLCK